MDWDWTAANGNQEVSQYNGMRGASEAQAAGEGIMLAWRYLFFLETCHDNLQSPFDIAHPAK
jgi:hypothetical protein